MLYRTYQVQGALLVLLALVPLALGNGTAAAVLLAGGFILAGLGHVGRDVVRAIEGLDRQSADGGRIGAFARAESAQEIAEQEHRRRVAELAGRIRAAAAQKRRAFTEAELLSAVEKHLPAEDQAWWQGQPPARRLALVEGTATFDHLRAAGPWDTGGLSAVEFQRSLREGR